MQILPLNKILKALATHRCLGSFIVLLIAVVVLVAAEFLVRTSWFWTLAPPMTREQRYIEPAFQRSPSPQVIFMGNSRIRLGVSPKIVGGILGLPAEEVSNLAFDNGVPHQFLQVYRAHRSKLGDTQLLVVEVEAKMLRKRGGTTKEGTSLSFMDQINLRVGRFWSSWGNRRGIGSYLKKVLKAKVLKQEPYFDSLHRSMLGSQPNRNPSNNDARSRTDLVNYVFNEAELQALQELVLLAKEDGVAVVLVDAPLGPIYRAMVEERFSTADAYWRRRVKEATGLQVEKLPLTNVRCADWKRCFVDAGHLNYLGAQGYSEDMGNWLSKQLPDLISGDGPHVTRLSQD